MDSDNESEQPVACASSHPQFEAQLENTPVTQLEVASTTPVAPETHGVATEQTAPLLKLPTEILERILLFACENDAWPGHLEKKWARLRRVCKAFDSLIMDCPKIWAQINVPLRKIEDVSNFLTFCPFKDRLHTTVEIRETMLLDESNQKTFDELKVAMAENPNHFTLSASNPMEDQLTTLGAQPSPLHIAFYFTHDLLPYLSTNIPNLQSLTLVGCRGPQTLDLNYPQLKTLIVVSCPELSNLSLSNLPNLKVLKVSETALKTLSLEHLEKLHTLDVVSCANLEALPLDKLPNPGALKVLKIRAYSVSQDAQNIPCHLLGNLHFLDIDSACLLDPDFLTLLPKLEHLELRSSKNAHTLRFEHKRLETLIIGICETFPLLSSENLPKLRVLEIDRCSGLTHLPLANMLNLKKLKVVFCQNLENITLEGFCNLDTVTLEQSFTRNHPAIDQMPMLETVEILRCARLNQLKLGTLPKLQSVSVQHAESLQTVDLSQLPCLEGIQLIACETLDNLSLTQIPALQTLYCLNCGLRTLSLKEVPNFQKLELFSCMQLKQFSVDKTPKLEKITLIHCPKLETLVIPGPLPHLHTVECREFGTALAEQIAALKAQAQANGGQVERL